MSEQNAQKIKFLKNVQTDYLDQKKFDLIDSIKTRANEHDERILDKTTMTIRGRMHYDIIPVVH